MTEPADTETRIERRQRLARATAGLSIMGILLAICAAVVALGVVIGLVWFVSLWVGFDPPR